MSRVSAGPLRTVPITHTKAVAQPPSACSSAPRIANLQSATDGCPTTFIFVLPTPPPHCYTSQPCVRAQSAIYWKSSLFWIQRSHHPHNSDFRPASSPRTNQLRTEHFVKIYQHESRASLLGGQTVNVSYRPGYPQREGFSSLPQKKKRKMYLPSSPWSWAFVGVSTAQAILILAFEWSV